jgi:PAS domain S-box-containing protein
MLTDQDNKQNNKLTKVNALIAVEFVVFSTFFAFLMTSGLGELSVRSSVLAGVAVLALFFTVAITCSRTIRHDRLEIERLGRDLKEERMKRTTLQKDIEKEMENRTFEMQRVVGALNREIGERTQAEEELRELQKRHALILDSAGDGILGLDTGGRVTFMNNAAEVILGWDKHELLGNTHHEFIHHTRPDGTPHPVEECPIYMAYRDGTVHYKSGDVFWCRNGMSFPVEYVSTPIKDKGMLTGAVVVFRDMNTFK